MSVMSDRWIRQMAHDHAMIDPFVETQKRDGVISYGLSSYVWTENLGRAHRVAAAIEAGMCFVNSQNVRDLRQPFGGTKASGTGREGGTWSYEVFLEPKNVAVSLGSHHIPHWGS